MGEPHESGTTALPLRGVILCCTSVVAEERTVISEKATAMGAKCVLDLTSDVTHLVCAALGSPKYKYVARMRADVKVLTPKWVVAMHDRWIQGEDIDIHGFEREHKFPTLYGLKISVTGIPDVAERKRVELLCIQNGATYHPDLTKQVTHLIAAAPTGRKYDFAMTNDITVVHPTWLNDSLARGMALEEQFYNPSLPSQKIGEGAKPAPLKHQTEVPDFLTTLGVADGVKLPDYRGKRKIRQTTANKISSQSQNLWENIMGHASNSRTEKHDQWEDEPIAAPVRPISPDSVSAPTAEPPKKTGILAEAAVYIHGFDKKKTILLRDALTSLAASIVPSIEALSRSSEIYQCVLVPREMRSSEYPLLLDNNMCIVTEWWLEACLHQKVLVEPSGNDITTMPIKERPIPDFNNLTICITLFTGIELTHWTKLIPMIGAQFNETLTKSCSILITNGRVPPKGAKVQYAIEKNIPIVKSEWLITCIREQRKVPLDVYQIGGKKMFHVEGNSMLQFDVAKRKANDGDNDSRTAELDANKRRRSEQVPNDSLSGNLPQQSRSSTGGEAKYKSKNREATTLRDCRVLVSREDLVDQKTEFEALARGLGADVVDEFMDELWLTHIVRLSLPKDGSQDFDILSRNKGTCAIVSPEWLLECQKTKRRVDEAAFPPFSMQDVSQRRTPNPSASSTRKRTTVSSSTTSCPRKPDSFQTLNPSSSVPSHLSSPLPITADSVMEFPIQSSGQENKDIVSNVAPDPPSLVPTAPLHDTVPELLNTRSAAARHNAMDSGLPANHHPPQRSTDLRWTGISQLLVSVDKTALSNAMDKPLRKPRTRLTGKLNPNSSTRTRQFSRTPSFASSTASQQVLDEAAAADLEKPPLSQQVEYWSEEDEMERRRVRRRLDPEGMRTDGVPERDGQWMEKPKAIDVDQGVRSVGRRTRRTA